MKENMVFIILISTGFIILKANKTIKRDKLENLLDFFHSQNL